MNKANIYPINQQQKNIPLYDTETEKSLLCLFFREDINKAHAAFLDAQAAGLKADYFYGEHNRIIYEFVKNHFDAGEPIDIVIANQELMPKGRAGGLTHE